MYAPTMKDARAGGLHTVRSSLRTLVYCYAVSAVISLPDLVFRFRFGAGFAAWFASGTLTIMGLLAIIMVPLAIAITSALAIGRLGALPSRLVVATGADRGGPQTYRAPGGEAEPTVATAPEVYALARWAHVAAWSVVAAVPFGDFGHEATTLLVMAARIVGPTLLVLWTLRVARGIARPLGPSLPIVLLALVAGRGGLFWVWHEVRRAPEWSNWGGTLVSMAIGVAAALVLRELDRRLGALPPQVEDEGPDDDARTQGNQASLAPELLCPGCRLPRAQTVGPDGECAVCRRAHLRAHLQERKWWRGFSYVLAVIGLALGIIPVLWIPDSWGIPGSWKILAAIVPFLSATGPLIGTVLEWNKRDSPWQPPAKDKRTNPWRTLVVAQSMLTSLVIVLWILAGLAGLLWLAVQALIVVLFSAPT